MFDRAEFADTCPQRANAIEWIPFKEGEAVVIHNTAPSAIIEMLRAKKVQLQVLSDAHVEKLAMNPGKGSLDCIVLIGMEVDARFLAGLYRKLKPEGRLIVLLHNRYGMSYFAGKPAYPSYGEQYFAAIEGKEDAAKAFFDKAGKTGRSNFYSLKGVEKLLEEAGIRSCTRYYLDPDGDFATNIYSDAYLPKAGDCSKKVSNLTYDRLAMFDEVLAYNQAAQDEMYPFFANDYLLVTGAPLPQVMVRYSNDRAPEYQIKTEICRTEMRQGVASLSEQAGKAAGQAATMWPKKLVVRKTPLHVEGVEHVQRMEQTYRVLCQQYDSSVFSIVPCNWNGESVSFPFVKGVALAECMKRALQKGDHATVFELFHTFLNKLRAGKADGFTNYDFIFNNILIEDDNWQVIDYEWTVNKAVPAEELAFRAAYCFSLEHSNFPFEDICVILGLDEVKVQQLVEQETAYQQSITGGQASIESLCAEHGGDVYSREALLRGLELSTQDNRVQIYEDNGKGFSEEQSYFVEHALTHYDEMELNLQVPVGLKALRIDPCEEPCLIQIKRLWWNGEEQFLDKQIVCNGSKGKGAKNSYPEYIFATRDPNFTVSLEKLTDSDKSQNDLKLQLEIHKISLQLANTLTKSIKRIL